MAFTFAVVLTFYTSPHQPLRNLLLEHGILLQQQQVRHGYSGYNPLYVPAYVMLANIPSLLILLPA